MVRSNTNDKYMVYASFPDGLKRHAYNVAPEDINDKLKEYENAGALKWGFRHMPFVKSSHDRKEQ